MSNICLWGILSCWLCLDLWLFWRIFYYASSSPLDDVWRFCLGYYRRTNEIPDPMDEGTSFLRTHLDPMINHLGFAVITMLFQERCVDITVNVEYKFKRKSDCKLTWTKQNFGIWIIVSYSIQKVMQLIQFCRTRSLRASFNTTTPWSAQLSSRNWNAAAAAANP